jgi:hypothetical protein
MIKMVFVMIVFVDLNLHSKYEQEKMALRSSTMVDNLQHVPPGLFYNHQTYTCSSATSLEGRLAAKISKTVE